MKDWMGGGVGANDREEARSERVRAERATTPHPDDCQCRPCLLDRYEPGDGS